MSLLLSAGRVFEPICQGLDNNNAVNTSPTILDLGLDPVDPRVDMSISRELEEPRPCACMDDLADLHIGVASFLQSKPGTAQDLILSMLDPKRH
jgi:hypothetical protein